MSTKILSEILPSQPVYICMTDILKIHTSSSETWSPLPPILWNVMQQGCIVWHPKEQPWRRHHNLASSSSSSSSSSKNMHLPNKLTDCHVGPFTDHSHSAFKSHRTTSFSPSVITFSQAAFISFTSDISHPIVSISLAKSVITWGGYGMWVTKLSAYHVTKIHVYTIITDLTPTSIVFYFYSASIRSWAIS